MNKLFEGALISIGAAFLFGTTLVSDHTVHADTPRVDMVDVSNHNGGTSRVGDTSC